MAHVDALSRNSLQAEIDDHEDEFYIHHMSINVDDFFLAALLKDELWKQVSRQKRAAKRARDKRACDIRARRHKSAAT
jgi:hypothetical protein